MATQYQVAPSTADVQQLPADAPVMERTLTIDRPAAELQALWREPDTVRRVMSHIAEVTPSGDGRTHWSVRGSARKTAEWDSQIVEERPGELLHWSSIDGASIPNEGWLMFRAAPQDRGTEVTLRFRLDPPGGKLGARALKKLGLVSDVLVGKALRRFKSLAETGEIPTTERQPAARDGGRDD